MDYFVKHGKRTPTCTIEKFDPTCTDASFEKECKIDRIIYKYTHNLPLENYQQARQGHQYLDVTQMPTDPEEIVQFFDAVQDQFMQVPATIRKEYGDNAFAFAQAVSGERFEQSEAAKRLDAAIRKSRVALNPTLEELLRRSKEDRQELIEGIKAVVNNKENNNNEA